MSVLGEYIKVLEESAQVIWDLSKVEGYYVSKDIRDRAQFLARDIADYKEMLGIDDGH